MKREVSGAAPMQRETCWSVDRGRSHKELNGDIMPKPTIWVLIADAHRARLFRREGGDGELLPALDREMIGESRPSREIASDRPGRSFDSGGEGRHAMAPSTDPARHAQASFAHDIAGRLDKERTRHAFDELIVVAPPEFLGDLRAAMSDPLRRMVTAEFKKDLSKQPTHELQSHLEKLLER